jgi:RyR domain
MTYTPTPLDTAGVELNEEVVKLTESLARHAHDVWAQRRIAEGWQYGPKRDDVGKRHPDLVPYEELSESEKEYDRSTAIQTLKAILALGYRLKKIGERTAP